VMGVCVVCVLEGRGGQEVCMSVCVLCDGCVCEVVRVWGVQC
jgi:hypothetical protein